MSSYKYKIKGARFLRKYTARASTPTYAAETDAQTIVDLFCDVPWQPVAVDQATMTSHSESPAEGDTISGLDRNVLDRDAFDAALFCAGHSGGMHRAYANAACYVFELPDSAIGKTLSALAARVTSDPYNAAGARLHVFTGSTAEIPMNCHTLRGEDSSGQVVADGSTLSAVAPRESRTSGGTSTWHPKTATVTIEPTGGLTLAKFLFVFVGLESYSTVRGNWLEGCSFIRNELELELSTACADLDADELNDLSPLPAAEAGVMLPVYSYDESTSPLHVRTFTPARQDGSVTPEMQWDFPASYTGQKSICWLPGATSDMAFIAWVGGDEWQPGDPFGFTPAASASNVQAIALTLMSPICPRIKLWDNNSDRTECLGDYYQGEEPDDYRPSDRAIDGKPMLATVPTTKLARVRVELVRFGTYDCIGNTTTTCHMILDCKLNRESRNFIHEGDFLANGEPDIAWSVLSQLIETNPTYLATNEGAQFMVNLDLRNQNILKGRDDTNIRTHPEPLWRFFDLSRTAPTAVSCNAGAFTWRIVGEWNWAKLYGSTYTAFKIKVFSGANGTGTVLHESSVIRMPPQEFDGSYIWNAPAEWMADIASWASWRIFTYNSRWKDDTVSGVANIS